jgi:hypothetical protein
MAYVLVCALRRIGLRHTQFANATCGTIRLRLLKIGALVTISVVNGHRSFPKSGRLKFPGLAGRVDFGDQPYA